VLLRDNRREGRSELGEEVYVGGVLFTALVVCCMMIFFMYIVSSHFCSTTIDDSFARGLGAG